MEVRINQSTTTKATWKLSISFTAKRLQLHIAALQHTNILTKMNTNIVFKWIISLQVMNDFCWYNHYLGIAAPTHIAT